MISTSLLILIILVSLFLAVGATVAIVIVYRFRWPMFWEKWEELVPGRLTRTAKGRCRPISFGDGGEEIFFLKGIKKYRAAYGKRIDKRTIVWAVGADGYWYNIVPQGIEKKLMEVGVMPIDRDMRLTQAQVRKGLENRYNDKGFMEKYGLLISFGMLFICILALGAFMWIGFDKQKDITMANLEATKASKETMDAASKIIAHLDNLQTGGSGYAITTART